MENFADLCNDYLICSTSYTTAIAISSLLYRQHDKVTRELSKKSDYYSKYLWQRVKPYVQEPTQTKEIITLSFDDSIEEKRNTDDIEVNYWH